MQGEAGIDVDDVGILADRGHVGAHGEQGVQSAVRGGGGGDEALDRPRIGEIEGDGVRGTTGFGDVRGGLVRRAQRLKRP